MEGYSGLFRFKNRNERNFVPLFRNGVLPFYLIPAIKLEHTDFTNYQNNISKI